METLWLWRPKLTLEILPAFTKALQLCCYNGYEGRIVLENAEIKLPRSY